MNQKILSFLLGLVIAAPYAGSAEPNIAKNDPDSAEISLPRPSDVGAQEFSRLLNNFVLKRHYANWARDHAPRTTGNFAVNDAGLVHDLGIHGPSKVRVYYSPRVKAWLDNNRKGPIADGGIILKELFARDRDNPMQFSETPTALSIMVKDSKGSWDGWFYSDGGTLQKPTPQHAWAFFDPNAGFATSCMNCHATTDNPESTYSSLNNIAGKTQHTFETIVSPAGLKSGLLYPLSIHSQAEVARMEKREKRTPAPYWPKSFEQFLKQPPETLIPAALDHVPQGPKPDGHRLITSSNCNACHNAVQLNSSQPNMTLLERINEKTVMTNLSSASEWRHSAMGLASRNPVFLAQLESERELFPHLADQIDNKCLGCHAPLGQRQFVKDKGPGALFTHSHLNKDDKYGALGRDGVSCVVCHQMSPENLGAPSTYAGHFALDDKLNHIYGPYQKVATLPMEQALGVTPKFGAHLSDSKLCASCHTVILPALQNDKNYTADQFSQLLKPDALANGFHEQTTFLEWQNSSFAKTDALGNAQKSCQSCHMPRTYKDQSLLFRIANIEDDTFPKVEHRADDSLLRMEPRNEYSRHSLHSVNIFLLEMFRQNPQTLGVSLKDNLLPRSDAKKGFDLAIETALETARTDSAKIKITQLARKPNELRARVQVSNQSGHKFPTGITFRRAFIELQVRAGDKIIWSSGNTDKSGVLGTGTDAEFVPLKTEFFAQNEFQPHYQTITQQTQVQIYEQLVASTNGAITTSFLNVNRVVKDNRILPRGWSQKNATPPIQPKFVQNDPDYMSDHGSDSVEYVIPLAVPEDEALTVTARLYYQSLPPYYLKHRFDSANGVATQRLYHLVTQLDLINTSIADWKLKVSEDKRIVDR